MSDDAAFLGNARLMAEAHAIDLIVNDDASIDFRHKYPAGHSKRRSKEDIDTFAQFILRHKQRLLSALGVKPKVDAVLTDAERLLRLLKQKRGGENCFVGHGDVEVELHPSLDRLIRGYQPSGEWILAAYRLLKLIKYSDHWRKPGYDKDSPW